MSETLEAVDIKDTLSDGILCYSLKSKRKRVLTSRENIFKPKCNRELKKKLKKYRLRRDGIEDPDILDVSKILVTSLKIKSPNSKDKITYNNNVIEQKEELTQGNYLIRMVRKKKICTKVEPLVSVQKNEKDQNQESLMSILSDEVGDKKHMDAFQLMMDSRNKSIGSNSPGKERPEEESKEIEEKKEIKAKRSLSLQKMALSKGLLKNKETEELRELCIERKMAKRAERLKQMITKSEKRQQKNIDYSDKQSQSSSNCALKTQPMKSKLLKLCDIFNETTEIIDRNTQSKTVPNDDIEFLNKLCPSIKKKENMLSYFQKIPKDDSEQLENKELMNNDKLLIKVKINSKLKKKTKIFTSSVDLDTAPETVENRCKIVNISNSNESDIIKRKRFKRKRALNAVEGITSPKDNLTSFNTDSRPKRNVKKPIKYTEDVQMFSSDEELHIFTPKKKKNNEQPVKSKVVDIKQDVVDGNNEKYNVISKEQEISEKNERSKLKLNKKTALSHSKGVKNVLPKSLKNDKIPVKLAPIFVAKMQLSPADIEAKQKFLKSGVPEKFKKKVHNPTNLITLERFHSVVHILQSQHDTSLHQEKDWFHGLLDVEELNFTHNEQPFNLLNLDEASNISLPVVSKQKPEVILKSIKCIYPKFPVYRTYHLLSGKSKGEFNDCMYPDLDNSVEIINGQFADVNNENPDQLNWCEKYKPTSSKQIIGNVESIKELKKWLETWTENLFKSKPNPSDSSDFSDFYHSDTDSRDANRNTSNVLILTGQTGSGKTSSIYAVASELAIKVIEVNASSKRTGKIMLQDLQEATQSHKVNRAKSGSDNSQKLHEEIISKKLKKRGRPKKLNNSTLKPSTLKKSENQPQILASQENIRTGMSLILIDDADIVFEQDDGFCSAIAQLIHSSKRPVILVTSSLSCPHLQRFLQHGKVLHMRPVLSRMLGTWLDVMCLVDVGKCCTGLGAKMLDFFKGDIRKTINYLQFYMNSNKYLNQSDEVKLSQLKHNIDDEDSSMSWVDSESLEAPVCNDTEADAYIDKQLQILLAGSPLNVFNVWWNLTSHKDDYNTEEYDTEGNSTKIHSKKEQITLERLDKIADMLDTISVIDYFDQENLDMGTNFSTRPWQTSENASLFENENFETYNKSSIVTKEICNVLINQTIAATRRMFKHENSLNYLTSTRSLQRNRDKIVSRHNKLTAYLHPAAVLDRRAIALDYWPTCRTICRMEKNKTDSNLKRNNRFCHYLKSLNILGKNDFFDSLADSLT